MASEMAKDPVRPRILVGTDFSECGEAAFEAAVRLAHDLGADLVLVHAFPKRMMPMGSAVSGHQAVEEIEGELEEDQAVELSTEWAKRARQQGIEVEPIARPGPPAEAILDEADKNDALMVVVGTHGRGGLRKLVLGSVAADVVHRSRRPVLVVPLAERK